MDFGRIGASTIKAGLPFGIAMGLLQGARLGLMGGLAFGAVSGVLFGFALGLFVEWQRKRMTVADYEGRAILHQGPANHFQRGEARGGWLLLTSRELVFRSHGVNFQNAPLIIAIQDLRGARPHRSLGVVPNAIVLERQDGTEEKLVVAGRAAWLAQLDQALHARVKAAPQKPQSRS